MGIGGERNGIADLAAVSDFATRALGSDGLDMDALAEAYRYLASILVSKVGETFLFDNLPFFGANARSTLPAPTLPSVGGSSGRRNSASTYMPEGQWWSKYWHRGASVRPRLR